MGGGWEGYTWFSCRNRWRQLWRDDHREDGGQEPAREREREGGVKEDGGWRTKEGRNDHSGLVTGKEMERRSDIWIDLERIRVIRGEGERSAGRQEG